MNNYFGKTETILLNNSIDLLYSNIGLTISGLPVKNLCKNYQLYLIKSVGFDLSVISNDNSIYLIDSYKYNQLTSDYRFIEIELSTPNFQLCFNDRIILPLFTTGYLKNKDYLQNLDFSIKNEIIKGYTIELIIEFCNLEDIIIYNEKEEIDLSNAKLDYKINRKN